MVATQPIEEITEVRNIPDFLSVNQEYNSISDLLFNEPHKRSHKPADFFLFQSRLLSISIEIEKIKSLYHKYKHLLSVDYSTFINAYKKMSAEMSNIIPADSNIVAGVSTEDECFYNYYEFSGFKIFFNLFFDKDEKEPVATIDVNNSKQFLSIEGSIDKVSRCLKDLLEKDFNV